MRWLLTILCLCLLSLNAAAQVDWDFLAMAASQQAQINGAGGGGGGGTDINAGLTSQYNLDDSTGTSATNSVSGRSALTPLSLHTWITGKFNGGLEWTNTDTRTSVGTDALVANSNKCGISVWFKRNASSDKCSAYMIANDATSHLGIAASWQNDDRVYCTLTNDANASFVFGSTNTGVWYNVIFNYDGTQANNTNRVVGYLMGTNVALTFVGTIPTTIHASATNTFLGRNPVGGNYHVGQIDDLRVYGGHLLDASQISQLQSAQ